ncbi:uncharacterized protein [Dysidea avara]|uniref:uncharacterized protein n=1 Tax=Dysidea avara TaxID=196820 RepID=UPI00332C69C0
MFFQATPATSNSDIDRLFNKSNLEMFFQKLLSDREYKPTTLSEKIRRMKLAIKYVIHAEDSMMTNKELFIKGSRLLELLTQWCLSLSKAIALQRQQHSLTITEQLPLVLDPQEFLENRKVQHNVQEARTVLGEGFDKPAAKILTAYAAACVVYGNGQRSGVVTNLRIVEFNQRQPCDHDTDKVVINCLHHKTGPQGIAHLVVTRDIEQLLVDYYNKVRRKIRTFNFSNSNRFFLTTNGSLYTQVYRRIKEALSVGRLKPPRPKDYRILVATDAARELNDADLRRVAKHLCHSTETSRRYYQFSNTNDSLLAHQALQNLSERRKWSTQHITALLKEWPLSNSPPGLMVCREIAKNYKMNRTGKDVLDKWRQLQKSL